MMRLLAKNTTVPVPSVLRSGTKEECPLELSLFIMMDHVANQREIHDALGIQDILEEVFSLLDQNIDEGRFQKLYGQLAVSCFNFPGPLSLV